MEHELNDINGGLRGSRNCFSMDLIAATHDVNTLLTSSLFSQVRWVVIVIWGSNIMEDGNNVCMDKISCLRSSKLLLPGCGQNHNAIDIFECEAYV